MSEDTQVQFKALGKSGAVYEGLETFPDPGIDQVTLASSELYSSCPITGQPDFYSLEVTYVPDGLCIESKSFKLMIQSYRDRKVFCEALAVEIRNAVVAAIRPYFCKVTLQQNPRGGVSLIAESIYSGDK